MAPLNRVKCPYCPQTFAKVGAALENHKVHKHWDALVRDHPEKYQEVNKATRAPFVSETLLEKARSRTDHQAVRGIIAKLDKGLPDFMEPNGADRLREIARKLLEYPGQSLHPLGEELITIAAALDFLYKEIKTLDVRRLQAKARRWDTVAKAVIESLNEEVRGV